MAKESNDEMLAQIILLQTAASQQLLQEYHQMTEISIQLSGKFPFNNKICQSVNTDIELRKIIDKNRLIMSYDMREILLTLCSKDGGVKDSDSMIKFCRKMTKFISIQDKLQSLFIIDISINKRNNKQIERQPIVDAFEIKGGYEILGKWLSQHAMSTDELHQDFISVLLRVLLATIPQSSVNQESLLKDANSIETKITRKENKSLLGCLIQQLKHKENDTNSSSSSSLTSKNSQSNKAVDPRRR